MQENKQPDMIYNGSLTEAGQEMVAYLESICKAADEQRTAQLSGHVGYYYVNVYKAKSMTAERFMEDFKNSIVPAVWRDMVYLKETAAAAVAAEQTQTQTNDLAAKLEALMSQVTDMARELTALKDKPKSRKPKAEAVEASVDETPETTETNEDEAAASEEA